MLQNNGKIDFQLLNEFCFFTHMQCIYFIYKFHLKRKQFIHSASVTYERSFLTLKWTSFVCFFKSAAIGKVILHRWQEFLMAGFLGFTMAFDFEDTPFKGFLSSLILGDMLIARKSKCFWSMFCYLFYWAWFIWQLFITTNKVPPTCNWFKESLDALL